MVYLRINTLSIYLRDDSFHFYQLANSINELELFTLSNFKQWIDGLFLKEKIITYFKQVNLFNLFNKQQQVNYF
jgi:hypothetical protein